MVLLYGVFFLSVRLVIPIIRSNDSTPVSYDTRTKREIADNEALVNSLAGEWQPDWARKHYRARRDLPPLVKSTMLNKQKRFLRLLSLKEEIEDTPLRTKRRIVPRQDYIKIMDATGTKRTFIPRFKRDVAKIRRKRQAFDQVAFERMS